MTRSLRAEAVAAREREARRVADAVRAGTTPALALRLEPACPAATRGGATASPPLQGQPLPAAIRDEMASRLGHDFASVRVATDRDADLAARGFGARAFAVGEQLSFAAGCYAPATTAGRALLAHELTHVVQQRGGRGPEIACDGEASLESQVADLVVALSSATSADARKPLVASALALGDQLAAALAKAKVATPPDGGEPADALRQLMQRLGSGLAGNSEPEAAITLAGKTPDVVVQSAIVNSLPSRSGVGGQQALFNQAAPLAGQAVAKPTQGQTSQQWLKAQTPQIGKTLAAFDRRGLKGLKRESLGLEMSEDLLRNYFVHSDADEKPDPLGDPTGATLKVDTATKQIKADCDVYATYGARLLREQGWATVGYLAIIPNEKKSSDPTQDRDGHAVALCSKPLDPADASKGTLYAGISNTVIRELGGHGVALADLDKAKDELLALALEVYDPPLGNYDVYYLSAGPGGRYDVRILDPKNNGLQPIKSVRPKATP